MAWGIDNIDSVVVPANRGILGQDRDAAFFFDRVGVHQSLGLLFSHIQSARLLQKLVNQRCFAMINMGYDGDVT